MYKCGWQGCEKAYGTLNHLNAHVTMQSHGQKRTPEGMFDLVCSSRMVDVLYPRFHYDVANLSFWLDREFWSLAKSSRVTQHEPYFLALNFAHAPFPHHFPCLGPKLSLALVSLSVTRTRTFLMNTDRRSSLSRI